MKVTMLGAGGGDTYYELGLVSGLISKGINIDFIGSDFMKDTNILKNKNVQFYNLRGKQHADATMKEKIFRIIKFYFLLVKYAYKTDSKLFHIQWLNKFIYFDRTFLLLYYKILGKKLIFTAHNVNAGQRDRNNNLMNRLTLKFMYKIFDKIIVHTNKMRYQLIEDFNIDENKVIAIPYGINNVVYKSDLTRLQARKKFQLKSDMKTLLFFGYITPYKGLEYLILALAKLKEYINDFKLIIAGKIDINCEKYWGNILKIIEENDVWDYIIQKIGFVPDEDIEIYFKAADILILPYDFIFQSGPLFMSYNFGLPVIATDVGSFKDDVIEGKTGFICRPKDHNDLANKINYYFRSDLFKDLETNRIKIIKYASEKYSWRKIGARTYAIYTSLQ